MWIKIASNFKDMKSRIPAIPSLIIPSLTITYIPDNHCLDNLFMTMLSCNKCGAVAAKDIRERTYLLQYYVINSQKKSLTKKMKRGFQSVWDYYIHYSIIETCLSSTKSLKWGIQKGKLPGKTSEIQHNCFCEVHQLEYEQRKG